MAIITWSWVEVAAQLLKSEEREAVLGDLTESGEGDWQGLIAVLGLVIRRQALLWKSWRPWFAAFGVALPNSFLLIGFSLFVSHLSQQLLNSTIFHMEDSGKSPGIWLLLRYALLLTAWSWSGGFVVGTVSRRTLWASVLLTCSPCLFCLARFRGESLSRFCLLLFLLPAIWGVWQGLQRIRLKWISAVLLAVALTVLMTDTWSREGLWSWNWTLLWPAWYLVVTAQRLGERAA